MEWKTNFEEFITELDKDISYLQKKYKDIYNNFNVLFLFLCEEKQCDKELINIFVSNIKYIKTLDSNYYSQIAFIEEHMKRYTNYSEKDIDNIINEMRNSYLEGKKTMYNIDIEDKKKEIHDEYIKNLKDMIKGYI